MKSNVNPYKNLDKKAFWRSAVSNVNMFDINDIWKPKFDINKSNVFATYGSCFAQHIGKSLHNRGYNWLVTELPPSNYPENLAKQAGYGFFSSRTGNIYTASLFYQWISWALDSSLRPDEIWENGQRFYDPFRPGIEENGFCDKNEVDGLLQNTIKLFRSSIEKSDFIVFTLGLTESWWNVDGYEYPMCPGTIAGNYDPNKHKFINQTYDIVLKYLENSIELARNLNPNVRFIFTVSPVPLAATYSGKHVLLATMESKSILRAVASWLSINYDCCDYFPSYEIICSSPFGGVFYEPNKRNVNKVGVDFVMNNFFSPFDSIAQQSLSNSHVAHADCFNIQNYNGCEEAMLELYGEGK